MCGRRLQVDLIHNPVCHKSCILYVCYAMMSNCHLMTRRTTLTEALLKSSEDLEFSRYRWDYRKLRFPVTWFIYPVFMDIESLSGMRHSSDDIHTNHSKFNGTHLLRLYSHDKIYIVILSYGHCNRYDDCFWSYLIDDNSTTSLANNKITLKV